MVKKQWSEESLYSSVDRPYASDFNFEKLFKYDLKPLVIQPILDQNIFKLKYTLIGSLEIAE